MGAASAIGAAMGAGVMGAGAAIGSGASGDVALSGVDGDVISLTGASGAGIVVSAGGVAGVPGAVWAIAEVLTSSVAARAIIFIIDLHWGGAGGVRRRRDQ